MTRPTLMRLALVLPFFLCAAQAQGAWGKTKDEHKTALLWVPEHGEIDWRSFEELTARHPDASLTVALVPSEIPETERAWLADRIRNGRIEVALRLAGDPILPLLHGYRKRDVIDLVALARVEYKKIFGRDPSGFVPGSGALSEETARFVEMQKIKWAAAGDAALRSPWLVGLQGAMNIIPFHVPESTAPAALAELYDVRAVVLDETSGSIAAGAGVDILTALLEDTRNDRWTSVALSMPHAQPYAVGPEDWPLFVGDIRDWTEDPLQKRAWRLYEAAAAALEKYQNSGAASLNTLNRATESLYRAQNSSFFLPKNLRSPSMERRLRAHLSKIYQTLNMKAPQALRQAIYSAADPLTEPILQGGEAPPESPERSAGAETMRISIEEGSLLFENPEGSTASLPVRLPALPPGAAAAHLWTLESLQVRWDDASVSFTVKMADLLERRETPLGFDALMLELYIDLNRLARRGATALLPERKGFLPTLDAWEYAIVCHGWAAELYRSVPGQPPALVERLEASADLKENAVRIVIPRSRLRGNPLAWGYLLLALSTEEGIARGRMPSPLDGVNGSPLLGVLAPLDAQKKLAASRAAYRRLSPVRIEEEATPAR